MSNNSKQNKTKEQLENNKKDTNKTKQNSQTKQSSTQQQNIEFESAPQVQKGSLSGLTKIKTHEHNHPRFRRNQIYYYIMLACLAVLVFLFLPESLVKENQGELVAVITSVGLDREKESNDYLITCQVISPDTSGQNQQKVALVSEKGKTITDSLTNLSLKLGKTIGFEHCSVIAIGESLTGEDLMPIIDHFYREGTISLNAIMVNVKGTAVDLIKQTSELNNLSSGSIQNNFNFNKDFFGSSKISTLGTFFNEYFKKGSSCIIAEINMNNKQTKAEPAESLNSGEASGDAKGEKTSQENNSGGDGGGGGGAGGEQLQDVSIVQNNGESIIYKNGRALVRANKDINQGFNFFDNRVRFGVIQVDNVNDEELDNATVTFTVENSTVTLKPIVDFENNKFILKSKIKIWGEISEVTQDKQTKRITKSYKDLLTDKLKEKMKEKIINDVDLAVQFCKINEVDALNFEDLFYKNKNKEYEKLKRKLSINDDFLNYVDVDATVEVNHQN